ncbi:sugar phosphate nucleotidyltransferase, partial [Arthrobacter wenxiniae]
MNTQKPDAPVQPGTSPLEKFFAVIPAGGVGTRLWPLSRAAAPKFLHDLTGSGST